MEYPQCSTVVRLQFVLSIFFCKVIFSQALLAIEFFFNFWLYNIILSITFNHRDSKSLNNFPTFGHVCI